MSFFVTLQSKIKEARAGENTCLSEFAACQDKAKTSLTQTLTYNQLCHQVSNLSHLILSHLNSMGLPLPSPGGAMPQENFDDKGSKYSIALIIPRSAMWLKCFLALDNLNISVCIIDCNLPDTRIKDILQQVKPVSIICEESTKPSQYHYKSGFFTLTNDTLLFTPPLPQDSTYPHEHRPLHPCSSYLICSSGSSGTPKVINMPSTGAIDVTIQQAKIFQLNEKSRCTWLLNPAFDASLSDIFTCLYSLAHLHIYLPNPSNLKELESFFIKQNISHSSLPTAIIQAMQKKDMHLPQSLVFGGERSKKSVLKALLDKNHKLYNCYGPTECSICCILDCVEQEKIDQSEGEYYDFVGFALDGFSINQSHSSCSIAHPTAISLGYFDEELNKKYFNNSCFITNDKLSIDKIIDNQPLWKFFGRNDKQFKYKGQLIEPSEIESVVDRHIYNYLPKSTHYEVCLLNDTITLLYSLVDTDDCLELTSPPPALKLGDSLSTEKKNELIKQINEEILATLPKYMLLGSIKYALLQQNANGKRVFKK